MCCDGEERCVVCCDGERYVVYLEGERDACIYPIHYVSNILNLP